MVWLEGAGTEMSQLELKLDYPLLQPNKCPHRAVVFNGIQEGTPSYPSVGLYTCAHPFLPHCQGTFAETRFKNYTGAVRHEGTIYLVRNLASWYK